MSLLNGRALRFLKKGSPEGQPASRSIRIGKELAAIRKELQSLRQLSDMEGKLLPITDKRFRVVRNEIKQHRRTLIPTYRLWTLWQAVQNTASLEGAVAEVGAYRGGSAHFLAASFVQILGHELPIEVIDTFEGHPQDKLSKHDSAVHRDPTVFTDTSYESVVEYLSAFPAITVRKGEFSAVAPTLPEQRYRLVHLDVDLFEPTLDCLRYFGPRLVTGGVVVLDDYGEVTCPGIRLAVDTYLAEDEAFQSWNPRTKQLVLVRR